MLSLGGLAFAVATPERMVVVRPAEGTPFSRAKHYLRLRVT
jgi:hypothetical protein